MFQTSSPRLLALALSGALLTGCVQFNNLFHPKDGTSSDCFTVHEVPAPMFHVAFTSPASAGATVSLEPWVVLSAPATKVDQLLPETFKATVDAARKEIAVTGRVLRTDANPLANCPLPALYMIPQAATLSLPVLLTETGTYTVRIASDSFTTERPPAQPRPDEPAREYPPAEATRSLVIN